MRSPHEQGSLLNAQVTAQLKDMALMRATMVDQVLPTIMDALSEPTVHCAIVRRFVGIDLDRQHEKLETMIDASDHCEIIGVTTIVHCVHPHETLVAPPVECLTETVHAIFETLVSSNATIESICASEVISVATQESILVDLHI
jgi:uncharacterized protein YjaG (DUF416 family)